MRSACRVSERLGSSPTQAPVACSRQADRKSNEAPADPTNASPVETSNLVAECFVDGCHDVESLDEVGELEHALKAARRWNDHSKGGLPCRETLSRLHERSQTGRIDERRTREVDNHMRRPVVDEPERLSQFGRSVEVDFADDLDHNRATGRTGGHRKRGRITGVEQHLHMHASIRSRCYLAPLVRKVQ
jgi:hypothetical protein